MELDDLKKLFDLLKETDITEVQIEKEGAKVRIKREKFLASFDMSHVSAAAHAHHAQPAAKATMSAQAEAEAAEDEAQHKLKTVTAPLVGTFYSSPSPQNPAYVQVGDTIKKGQVLCIIEAMKLMNEIESEFDGVIRRALVENGQAVEYGEPLFLVEPF